MKNVYLAGSIALSFVLGALLGAQYATLRYQQDLTDRFGAPPPSKTAMVPEDTNQALEEPQTGRTFLLGAVTSVGEMGLRVSDSRTNEVFTVVVTPETQIFFMDGEAPSSETSSAEEPSGTTGELIESPEIVGNSERAQLSDITAGMSVEIYTQTEFDVQSEIFAARINIVESP